MNKCQRRTNVHLNVWNQNWPLCTSIHRIHDTHDWFITNLSSFSKNVLKCTIMIFIFAFTVHFSISTAVLNIHFFFFPLVYKKRLLLRCIHHQDITMRCIKIRCINNSDFETYLVQMYSVELEIKTTTESNISASSLDLLLSIGRDDQLHPSIYENRDDFNFIIKNLPILSRIIPSSPAYGDFILQLMRHTRACFSCWSFILKALWLSNKLLEQG